MKTAKKKLTYDDIKLGGEVKTRWGIGKVANIDNTSLLDGIDEPIFKVKLGSTIELYYGLKYILKYYITQ